MNEPRHEKTILTAQDGHEIHLRAWKPEGDPVGAIQLLHGLGEHIGRYERFALAAVGRGYTVYGHDHRGHGASEGERGYFADDNGWHNVVEDVRVVNDHIREIHATRPVIMLGHSMGSFIAQTFAMHYGARLRGLLLSGSSWPAAGNGATSMLTARNAAAEPIFGSTLIGKPSRGRRSGLPSALL